jgi:hypothetical protein
MAELKAFYFRYSGAAQVETYRFYNKHIRGFLRWHRGDAVTDSLPIAQGIAGPEVSVLSSCSFLVICHRVTEKWGPKHSFLSLEVSEP